MSYTVSQINSYINNMFTQDYLLQSLEVEGEISGCKYHSSGHIYFTLKDETSQIACVMFKSNAQSLSIRLRDGMSVLVKGSVTVYERDGKYQLYARQIRENGAGVLYERFEKLKEELREMGMFDPSFKQPIPRFAKTIGIVTAPTGAAIRDILNIAGRRNPYAQLILYPAKVQGEGAAATVVKGIQALERRGVDLIIVGRGGGSIEDLWAFNEREVAQAIFDCSIPIISAVGHETDFTIADFVADKRAATPSEAAELATCEIALVLEELEERKSRLNALMSRKLMAGREQLSRNQSALSREMTRRIRDLRSSLTADRQTLDRRMTELLRDRRARLREEERILRTLRPEAVLERRKAELSQSEKQLRESFGRLLLERKNRLQLLSEKLTLLSPEKKLSGGFAYVEGGDGKAIANAADAKPGDALRIHMRDGVILGNVTEVTKNA